MKNKYRGNLLVMGFGGAGDQNNTIQHEMKEETSSLVYTTDICWLCVSMDLSSGILTAALYRWLIREGQGIAVFILLIFNF